MNVIHQTANFASWLRGLADLKGKARIVARVEAARLGHWGDCKPLASGVSEMRVDCGPGYRIYFLREGAVVYLLLCGGDKSSQRTDIRRAVVLAEAVSQARAAARRSGKEDA
jgi:putative addiction module killer protein